MKEIKNKNALYEEPILEVIHLTEADIITTSGDPFLEEEGEFVPAKADNLFR